MRSWKKAGRCASNAAKGRWREKAGAAAAGRVLGLDAPHRQVRVQVFPEPQSSSNCYEAFPELEASIESKNYCLPTYRVQKDELNSSQSMILPAFFLRPEPATASGRTLSVPVYLQIISEFNQSAWQTANSLLFRPIRVHIGAFMVHVHYIFLMHIPYDAYSAKHSHIHISACNMHISACIYLHILCI